jgi:hypothetical protein
MITGGTQVILKTTDEGDIIFTMDSESKSIVFKKTGDSYILKNDKQFDDFIKDWNWLVENDTYRLGNVIKDAGDPISMIPGSCNVPGVKCNRKFNEDQIKKLFDYIENFLTEKQQGPPTSGTPRSDYHYKDEY